MQSFVCGLFLFHITFSKFTPVVACIRTSFPVLAKEHSIVWIHYVLFISSSVDVHLGCFHFLAIVNNPAVTIKEQVCMFSFL